MSGMQAGAIRRPVMTQDTNSATQDAVRVTYLDWLRVIATFGVFLFHATNVFGEVDFHIKNAEESTAITVFDGFFFPWGMPLFFLIAGAGSWFALQRRTPAQYARERFNRLLIPLIAGTLLLSPVEFYVEWLHKVQTGVLQGSFLEFIRAQAWVLNPKLFGEAGYHLWFLGFLFCYSMITLPLFRWLKGESGQGFTSRMAKLCEHRGGIVLFVLPLLLVRLGLQPFFPDYQDWADFGFLLSFFVLGYLLFADQRFTEAIRRDWPITLGVGIAAFLAFVAITTLSTEELDIEAAPRSLLDLSWWGLVTICSWCWTAFMVFVAMRFLNSRNRWLHYGQEALMPFFVFHLAVLFIVAYFVVQWQAGVTVKFLAVVAGSFVVTLGIYELVVRRLAPLRALFGMKAATMPRTGSQASAPAGH